MGDALRVELSEDGADAERLDMLTRFLRQELLQLDVEDVTTRRAGEPLPGARAFDLAAVNELMVYLRPTAEGLLAVVSTIRKWLARGPGVRRTVRMELGGDVLELSEATEADLDRLITLFVGRNSTRQGEQ
ncbi:MAG: hypothetical protein WCF33_16405 [Pseudonocardiaceae bacterium]